MIMTLLLLVIYFVYQAPLHTQSRAFGDTHIHARLFSCKCFQDFSDNWFIHHIHRFLIHSSKDFFWFISLKRDWLIDWSMWVWLKTDILRTSCTGAAESQRFVPSSRNHITWGMSISTTVTFKMDITFNSQDRIIISWRCWRNIWL